MFYFIYCEIGGNKSVVVCEEMKDCEFIDGFVYCKGVKFLKDTSFNNCDIVEISFPKEQITHFSKATVGDISQKLEEEDESMH